MSQLYTKAQWAWCWERYREGYTLKTISKKKNVRFGSARRSKEEIRPTIKLGII